MKRKRGHKKGKQKQPKIAANAVSVNTEDNSVLDDFDDTQIDSPMEVNVAANVGPNHMAELAKTDADGLSDKPVEQLRHGRVKVKLKTSKMLDHQSNPNVFVEKQREDLEKMEDSSNSLPEIQTAVYGKLPRKAGSIKIKSSRGLGSLSTILNQTSSPVHMQGERTTQITSDNDKTVDSLACKESQQREPNLRRQDSLYNEKELRAALLVIKKVMKMNAAEPFNAPVNPVALGIPDYFDIIETPMDFGTICNNLEHGSRYMNSEDVFQDVQYIWENCYKYNNKGDYILDLMKQVKKNFTKYWMSAGLYSDPRKRTSDTGLDQDSGIELPLEDDHGREKILDASGRKTDMMVTKQKNLGIASLNGSGSIQVENVTPSSQEKLHGKGTSLKHKTRRRHGIRQHKFDCLCAVCVVRRRRQERLGKAQTVDNQIEISDGNPSQEFGQEEGSLGNPCSEDASSNLEHSPDDPDADADLEEQEEDVKLGRPEQPDSPQQETKEISENEMEIQKTSEDEPSEQLQLGEGSREEPNPQFRSQETEDSGFTIQPDTQKDGTPPQQKQEVSQQTKIYSNLDHDENPLILELSRNLFPNNPKSVWSGPHSLSRHHRPVRSSAIHAAIATFMK